MDNIYNIDTYSYPHQPSVRALKQSAANGCDFCQFIMDCLDATESSAGQHHDPKAPVSLSLEIRSVRENRKDVPNTYNVKQLLVLLAPAFYSKTCTLDLFTPSAAHIVSANNAFHIGKPKLDPNIGSSATFHLARKWLNECQQSHLVCLRDSLPTLPTRVIDAGTFEFPTKPRLIISNGLRAHYVALSHCWGGDIATSLMTDTLSTFQAGIPYTELPQNFRDAIIITRELGVRYLWIDSLCIIQDSKKDWASESARMGTVYRDSTVTISAMAPANSSLGILNSQEPPPRLNHKLRVFENENQSDEVTVELVHPTHKSMETMRDLWEDSPLTSRGWTLQEFVLSPRHIFYGRHQIYWKCPDGFQSAAEGAVYDDELPVHPKELARVLHRERLSTVPSSMPDRKQLLRDYYSLVKEFCMRKLTNPSDKLSAFSGIASGLLPVLGGDYLAGIWTCDLARGLLWRSGRGYMERDSEVPLSCKDSSAPSWSWAAAPWIIAYNHLDLPPTPWQVRPLSHDIVPVDRVNPFGQVKSARLVVKGFIIPIIPTSPEVDMSRLVKAGEVELTQWDNENKVYLFHPLLTTKRSENAPTSVATPHDSRDQTPDEAEVWRAIDSHWNRNAALPIEIEDWIGDEVLIDSLDFRDDGYCVLIVHAETNDRLYWAQNTVGLMLRPIRSKSGDVYKRVGYLHFYRVRLKWLQTLEARIITLV